MGQSEDVQVGAWGGPGSSSFEWKTDGRISKIVIKSSGSCIVSISFGYVCNCDGQEHMSPTYGGNCGNTQSMSIEEGEEIIELSGSIRCSNSQKVIASLCFKTNKKTCNFGSATQDKFSLPVNKNNTKYVGFHGKYGANVNSIGAFLLPK